MTDSFSGTSPETLDLLLRRRSASAKALGEPGPTAQHLALILTAGSRVPDHGRLEPWRFLVIEGEGRVALGAALERALVARKPDVSETLRRFERNRFLKPPLTLIVISAPKTDKPVPEWEQRLSAGAACQNIMLAATALGFGAQWVTEWYAYDEGVTAELGLTGAEKVAGVLFIGTASDVQADRDRPALDTIMTHWTGPVAP